MRTWTIGIVLFLSSFAPLLAFFGLLESFGAGLASYIFLWATAVAK
jgi:hypothetical protein